MTRLIPLACLLLASCATPGIVSCDKAPAARKAAQLALAALDRACPIEVR